MQSREFCGRYEEILHRLQHNTVLAPALLADFQECNPCDPQKQMIWDTHREKIKVYLHIIERCLKDPELNPLLSQAISWFHLMFCPPEKVSSKEAA